MYSHIREAGVNPPYALLLAHVDGVCIVNARMTKEQEDALKKKGYEFC